MSSPPNEKYVAKSGCFVPFAVAITLASVGILISLPGVCVHRVEYSRPGPNGVFKLRFEHSEVEHGWPWVFLYSVSPEEYLSNCPPAFSKQSWLMGNSSSIWKPRLLIADLIVTVLIPGIVGYAITKYWFCNRIFKLTTKHALVLIAIISIALGLHVRAVRSYEKIWQELERLSLDGTITFDRSPESLRANEFAVRLLGRGCLSKRLYLPSRVFIENESELTATINLLAQANSFRELEIGRDVALTSELLQQLKRVESVRHLGLNYHRPERFINELAEFEQLHSLVSDFTEEEEKRLSRLMPDCKFDW